MNYLADIEFAENGSTIAQLDFEALEARVFQRTRHSTSIIGPPTSGAHLFEEIWIDSLWSEYVCVTAGTPGTWRQIVPAAVASFPSGTIPTGYEVVNDTLARRRYRYNGSGWDRINRHRHLQVSPTNPWPVAHNLGYNPAAITVVINGALWMPGIEYVDANNLNAHFLGDQSGELYCE